MNCNSCFVLTRRIETGCRIFFPSFGSQASISANKLAVHYTSQVNTLNAELNLICHLQAWVGAHHILHVSRVRVKPLDGA